MKKILSVLLALVMLSALCVSAVADEVVEFTFGNFSVEDQAWHLAMDAAIEQFNADHEGVAKIINDRLPPASYNLNVATLGASGDLQTLVFVTGDLTNEYAQTGVIQPLSGLIAENGIADKISPDYFVEHTNNGEIYAIPAANSYFGFIVYNKEIFEEAGVEQFPTTMDEFYDACDKINAAGYIPMGMGDKDLWPADSISFSALVNRYCGNEWYENILAMNGEANFTDQCFIDALNAYLKIAEIGGFNKDAASIDNNQRMSLYMNKKVAMISAGQWECSTIHNDDPELEAISGIAPWPGPVENEAAPASIEVSNAWGIALSSKATDEQKMYAMEFMANYYVTEEFARTVIENTSTSTAWECEYDASKISPLVVSLFDNAPSWTACKNWDSTLPVTVKAAYQRGLQSLIIAETTAEAIAEEMQWEYEDLQ